MAPTAGTGETGHNGGPIVPVIDIAGLTSGDPAAKAAVAQKIGKACEDIGFFVVVNHGIPRAVIDAAWKGTLDFFDRPLEEKRRLVTEDEAAYPYGYSALGAEYLSQGKAAEKRQRLRGGPNSAAADGADTAAEPSAAGDLKEMFSVGPRDAAAGMAPRRLPEQPEGFAEAYEAYYEAANGLAGRLLEAFALALGLEEGWFRARADRHISALRANNYPDQSGMAPAPGSIRCSAHTDYGTLTILRSGGPGLQVSKDRDQPSWHDVPFVEDGFVINLGDLMRRWTNDRWSSTLHRVVNPPAGQEGAWGRRLALAFFHNLNKDAVVEAIPSCVSPERPALYEPIVAGQFLMLKHLASNGKADPDAHMKTRAVGG